MTAETIEDSNVLTKVVSRRGIYGITFAIPLPSNLAKTTIAFVNIDGRPVHSSKRLYRKEGNWSYVSVDMLEGHEHTI
jgi:hypothetical protein